MLNEIKIIIYSKYSFQINQYIKRFLNNIQTYIYIILGESEGP